MTRYSLGTTAKDVVEQPLIANRIVDLLLDQKDWMSVLSLRHVFRIDDAVRDKLDPWKKQNEENKYAYDRYFFDFTISRIVVRLQTVSNFKKRLEMHDDMCWYAYDHFELFQASVLYNPMFQMLMHYVQHEPFYERKGIFFMRLLYPNLFYDTDLLDVYDDHENNLFDDDY
jgi:hypothetical protein